MRRTEELSKKEKEVAMWVFDKISGVPHSKASFFGHLYNTFFILKEMKVEQNVCIAGLCHALYGTETFSYVSTISREELTEVIGEKAEKLVYLFSLEERDERIIENKDNYDSYTQLSLLQMLYVNKFEQHGRISVKSQEEIFEFNSNMRELRKKIISMNGKVNDLTR